MSEIPDDIMQTARKALHEALRDKGCGVAIQMSMHTTSKAAFETAIARALLAERLAERERCAQRLDDEAFAIEETARALRQCGKRYANDSLPIARALRDQAAAIRGGSHE